MVEFGGSPLMDDEAVHEWGTRRLWSPEEADSLREWKKEKQVQQQTQIPFGNDKQIER
jgi:hypothetical protein